MPDPLPLAAPRPGGYGSPLAQHLAELLDRRGAGLSVGGLVDAARFNVKSRRETVRIGQLAAATDVPTSTLRYYERAGLLPPPTRTEAGYRDYQGDVVGRVAFVRNAQAAGLTLAQVGEVLSIRDDGRPPCTHVAELVDDRLTDIDRRLRELRRPCDAGLSPARGDRRRPAPPTPRSVRGSRISSRVGAGLGQGVEEST